MTNQKQLPSIVRLRLENILKTKITACYLLDGNQDVAKCELATGGVKYVNLLTRKEVPFATLNITLEDAGADDTNKLVGKSPEEQLLSDIQTLYGAGEEEPIHGIINVAKNETKRATTKKATTKKQK